MNWIIEVAHASYSNHLARHRTLEPLYACASGQSITLAARTCSHPLRVGIPSVPLPRCEASAFTSALTEDMPFG